MPREGIIHLNNDVQLLRLGDTMFVLDLEMLERNIEFSALMQQAAIETVETVEELDSFKDIEVLKDTLEDSIFACKLSKIKNLLLFFSWELQKRILCSLQNDTST